MMHKKDRRRRYQDFHFAKVQKQVLLTFEVCINHFYIKYLCFIEYTYRRFQKVSLKKQVDNSSNIFFLGDAQKEGMKINIK